MYTKCVYQYYRNDRAVLLTPPLKGSVMEKEKCLRVKMSIIMYIIFHVSPDKINECYNDTLNNCWNDLNAHCVDYEVGYICKCDYEDLGVRWNNIAKTCQLPTEGNLRPLFITARYCS